MYVKIINFMLIFEFLKSFNLESEDSTSKLICTAQFLQIWRWIISNWFFILLEVKLQSPHGTYGVKVLKIMY